MTRRTLVLGLAVLPTTWAIRRALPNWFVLTNESGQAVYGLTVTVSDKTLRFDSLAPGDSVTDRFGIPVQESRFVIQAWYADGTRLEDSTGYVVWEECLRTFRLVILPDGMVTQRLDRA